MSRTLRKENARRYLKGGGVSCPFCGSSDIGSTGNDFMEGCVDVYVSCGACHDEWVDHYVLGAVRNDNNGFSLEDMEE